MLKPIMALTIAASLALAGCASQSRFESSNNSSLTSDQRALRANAARVDPQAGSNTAAEGALLIGLLGGAIGCGVALAAGGDGGDCATWGLVGAGAGAVGGYIAGDWVAGQQQNYASREQHLNAVIDSAQLEIDANRQAAQAARGVTQTHRTRLATLQAQYDAKKITKNAYRQEVAEMSLDRDAMAVAVQSNYRRIAELEQLINQGGSYSQVETLRRQRDQLAAENAILQQQLDQMASLLASTPSDVRV